MPSPRRWMLRRPGMLIPVFFLSSSVAAGQFPAREATVVSLGGSFTNASGFSSAAGNQAGLGWIDGPSLSLHQSLPLLTGGLTFSSICIQSATTSGGIGAHLSTLGIPGLNQSSLWVSSGVMLFPGVSAGAGLNVRLTSTGDRFFHRPGIGCALGIQVRIGEDLMIGGHIRHPAAWTPETSGPAVDHMMISSGVSCIFFRNHTYYTEFHLMPGTGLQICQGIRSIIGDRVGISFGFHNHPCSFTGGLDWDPGNWTIQFAYEFMPDNGPTPHITLAREW